MRFRTEPAHRLHQDQDPVSPSEQQEHRTKCSMRLPRMGAAAKLLTMLRWVRPDQIAIPKPLREYRNKNLDIFATFLRLRIVASFPIADWGAKAQVNRFHGGMFSLCGDGREPVIAKKLQKRLNFCFRYGWITPTGGYRNGYWARGRKSYASWV